MVVILFVLTRGRIKERWVRGGRGRVHVGQLNGRRGRRGVGHGGTVVTGISSVTVVGTRIGRVSAASATATSTSTTSTTSATASTTGRRWIYVRASVRAVGRVRCRCARPITAASGGHAAALTASVIVCG